MKDILLIQAPSSAGKDFILNKLLKIYGFHKMISYTTRPKRPNEIDGLDYHFVTEEDFRTLFASGKLFEKTEYETEVGTWYYGFGVDSIKDGYVNICIINPHGREQFMESQLKDRLISVLIDAPMIDRYNRYSNRLGREMTITEKAEAWDRLGRDLNDFYMYDGYDLVVQNGESDDVEVAIDSILQLIKYANRDMFELSLREEGE